MCVFSVTGFTHLYSSPKQTCHLHYGLFEYDQNIFPHFEMCVPTMKRGELID